MNIKIKNIPFYADEKEFIKFVDRITKGKYGKRVRFFVKESESGFDEYSLKSKGGIIEIYATSGVAGGVAFNAYLKKYCKYYFGILTENGELPEMPPETDKEISDKSVFHYRYAFNYCTFGYSYAFNTWEDWERITDYLILSGYNLVLNPIGNECVWVELLQKFGYTRSEAKQYISAPNYLPWQWMMNLSAFNSNYPDYWFVEQAEISRKFNKKLKAFGMSVLLPGYCGAVPDDFGERCKGLKIIEQGKWGGFTRPSILLPENEIFFKIAETYYELQNKILGAEDFHYYSTDPFHEGGNKNGVDMTFYAKSVLTAMKKADKNAVWAFQGWNGNPDRKMLSALNKDDVLIMNLHADISPDGGDDFLGYPHIYCVVNNFGGEQAMRGASLKTYELPHKMSQDNSSACCGIGIIPEGVECDEILFDIVGEISIKSKLRSIDTFLSEYLSARYGCVSDDVIVNVFKTLFNKVYTADIVNYQHESGLIACPSIDVDRVCFWAGHSVSGDNAYLKDIAKTLLKYYEKCKNSDSYIKDVAALLRQYVANESWKYIYGFNEAIRNKNISEFENNAEKFLKLFDIQERIVDCDKDLNLQRYLDKASNRGNNEKDKFWLIRSAKLLITFWGEDKECWALHDYAAREYGDMLRFFYKPRWERYISSAREAIKNGKEVKGYDRYKYDVVFLEDKFKFSFYCVSDLKSILQEI